VVRHQDDATMPLKRVTHSRTGLAILSALSLVIGVTLGGHGADADERYSIRSWQNEDGMPVNYVTAVSQTQDGYLWVGTLAGLARFDGNRFTVFDADNAPELENGRITSLFEDSEGVLWIGHETGELTRLAQGVFEAVPLPGAWQSDVISTICSDEKGDLWVHSRMGRLARVRDGLVIPPAATEIDRYGLSVMTGDPKEGLWVTRSGMLQHLREGVLTPVTQAPAQKTNFVQAVCRRAAGGLWVVRGGAVYSFQASQWTQLPSGTMSNLFTVARLCETRTGNLVIGTIDQGLWIITPAGTSQNLNRATGLSANWVSDIEEDREGNLWVGTVSAGLNMICPAEFKTWNPPDNWNGMPVMSVSHGPDNSVWIGTEGAGLYRLQTNGAWEHYSAELTSKFVWSVAPDPAGRLWLGTWGGGLMVQQGNRFVVPQGMTNFITPITAILHGSNGVVWLGTRRGLMRYSEGRAELIDFPVASSAPDVRAIAQDAYGSIWFGMMGGGLGCLSNGVVKQFRKSVGMPSDFISTLYFDNEEALWIGTSGSGLIRHKDGAFTHISESKGLPSSIVMGLQKDEFGYFWISTAKGIFRVRAEQLNQCADGAADKLNGVTFGIRDGLATVECSGGFQPSVCRTDNGRMWFPTRKGLASVQPGQLLQSGVVPVVVIEEVRVNGRRCWANVRGRGTTGAVSRSGYRSQDQFPNLLLPPGVQRFEVTYTGLGLSHPERLGFRYRLSDLDTEWVHADRLRTASYSYLPPGSYTFQLQVSDYEGNWTRGGNVLRITVEPFFWQTMWFRLLVYLLFGLLVAGLVWLMLRRRQQRKLEAVFRQREIERERTRIARDIHDDLGASLTRISMLSQPSESELQTAVQPLNRLDLIYDTTREMIRAMDEIVWAVNPDHDTLDSVTNYLTRFAQSHLIPAGIRCRFNLPIEVPHNRVRAETRHHLFLAFKEAIQNILKHAKASEIRFSLKLKDGFAHFSIADDGRGLLASAASPDTASSNNRIASGLGLENMKQRLAAVGGRCEVKSGESSGTEVTLSVPLEGESPRDGSDEERQSDISH